MTFERDIFGPDFQLGLQHGALIGLVVGLILLAVWMLNGDDDEDDTP